MDLLAIMVIIKMMTRVNKILTTIVAHMEINVMAVLGVVIKVAVSRAKMIARNT